MTMYDDSLETLLGKTKEQLENRDPVLQREHDTLKEIAALGLDDVVSDELNERLKALSEKYGSGVLIDMVRRIMPSVIAHDIVGIQPMKGPSGLVYRMKNNYGSLKGTGVASTDP